MAKAEYAIQRIVDEDQKPKLEVQYVALSDQVRNRDRVTTTVLDLSEAEWKHQLRIRVPLSTVIDSKLSEVKQAGRSVAPDDEFGQFLLEYMQGKQGYQLVEPLLKALADGDIESIRHTL